MSLPAEAAGVRLARFVGDHILEAQQIRKSVRWRIIRPARDHRFNVPTRPEVEARLTLLIEDEETRAEVAEWASEFIHYDDPEIHPPVDDPVVWRAITQLAGADLQVSPSAFLHGQEDFRAWLLELRHATPDAT